MLKQLKENNQDHEWYPTTAEIIDCIKGDLKTEKESILDCGAGDGRVLESLSGGDLYAIERSTILINALPHDTILIGTEFHETTLMDKEVNIVFSNPPYSEYERWVIKIIREANATACYLVIPERWVNSVEIKKALQYRECDAEIMGSFDFLNAERKARANVNVVKITLKSRDWRDSDPFNKWFDENFTVNNKEDDKLEPEKIKAEIAKTGSVIQTLVDYHNADMIKLQENFKTVSQLDAQLLEDINIDIRKIKKALKQRIKGLKNLYWDELFKHYSVITRKLTTATRAKIQRKLTHRSGIDFTVSNCIAVSGWVIRQGNDYYDSQLIDVVEKFLDERNIKKYKSNERLYTFNEWRYFERVKSITHYKLELRIIIENQGRGYDHEQRSNNGLKNTQRDTIDDLIVIAGNLGFYVRDTTQSVLNWQENNNQNIMMVNGEILMNIKVFMNGNIHFKFNKKFIMKLNVEFGRLKGWLTNSASAAHELDISENEASECFNSNLQLMNKDLKLTLQA